MKIALVSRRFDKNSGSAEWIYAEWLRKEFMKKGIEVFPIEQKGATMTSSRLMKMGYDTFILPFRLMQARIFKKAEIFYFLGENEGVYSSFVRMLGAKSAVECYDIMRVKNREFCLDKMYFSFVYRTLNMSDKVIAISSSTKEDLIKDIGIKKEKITIIPPIYRDFRPARNIRSRKVIGYLGALGGRKRADFFLNVAEEIKKRGIKNMEIQIYSGRGKDEKLSEGSKKFKGIIKINGTAAESKIESIYNSFDFFVFPSSYEGLGLPAIEAMMCGKPCFILKDSYFPKEVKEGCTIVKDEKELIEKILQMSSQKNYEKAYDFSLNHSKKFGMEANLGKIISLFKKL